LIGILIYLINITANVLELIVVIDAVLSFFVHPLHPIRLALGRVVRHMLAPIQQVIPPIGGFDISPIVLIFLIEIVRSVLVHFLLSLAW
jgi:YggT family protein